MYIDLRYFNMSKPFSNLIHFNCSIKHFFYKSIQFLEIILNSYTRSHHNKPTGVKKTKTFFF